MSLQVRALDWTSAVITTSCRAVLAQCGAACLGRATIDSNDSPDEGKEEQREYDKKDLHRDFVSISGAVIA